MNRAERRRRTENKIRQRARQVRQWDGARALLEFEPGRWAKKSPFDCGRPGCGVCGTGVDPKGDAERIERQAARQGDLE